MAGEIKAPAPWEADPARVKRIAVAQDGRMHVFDHVPPLRFPEGEHLAYTADTMLRGMVLFALHEDCSSLWLMPPHWGDIGQQMRELLDDPPAGREVTELSSDGHLAGLRISRVNADGHHIGAPFMVYLTDQADHWGIAGQLAVLAPAQLAEGLMLAAHLLDMQLRFSPSYVGLQVMRQVLARSKADITPLAPWAEELVQAHRPTYVQWSHAITLDRFDEGVRIYKYDRNSSFLASAGEVPVGDPVATPYFINNHPGFYHLAAWPKPGEPAAVDLPGPFHEGEGAGSYPPYGGEDLWAWEPQIRLALRQGWEIEIKEGWYWPKGNGGQVHDLLRPWRERMWRAREAAVAYGGPVGAVAKSLIKKAAVAAVGRLMQQRGRQMVTVDDADLRDLFVLSYEVDRHGEATGMAEVESDLGKTDLKAPHWWSTIIANANERLFTALYDHGAYHPIAAYVDAVYCLSPWPIEDIAPDRLGKWKLERSMWLSREQVEQYNVLDSAAARIKFFAHLEDADGTA